VGSTADSCADRPTSLVTSSPRLLASGHAVGADLRDPPDIGERPDLRVEVVPDRSTSGRVLGHVEGCDVAEL